MSLCSCSSPSLMKRATGTAYCSTCGFLFDYEAWLTRPKRFNENEAMPDPRRVQCEAVALKIYEQLDRINMEANYAGQVQQCEEAVTGEWCIRVADIIQKELQWT